MSGEQSRRHFLRSAAGATAAFALAACTSHKTARRTFTYPDEPIFGERIDAGSLDHILSTIDSKHAPFYVPAARAYVNRFPDAQLAVAEKRYPEAIHASLDAGVIVLYQRCTHLGCRVPFCSSSQYFECPCHTARFDRVGEQRAGPAPRGMDLMAARVEQGRLVIDSGTIVHGMPEGTNTIHQEPSGPFCVA